MIENYRNGFTLLELMIVIGLLVAFTAMLLPYGINFYDSRILDEESITLANVLDRARSHAVSGKEDSDWGVDFFYVEEEYKIIKGSGCGGEVYQTFKLSQGVELESDINCVIFERHTGNPKVYMQ